VSYIDIYYGKQNFVFCKDSFDVRYNSKTVGQEDIFAFSIVDINADGIKDIAFNGDSGKIYFIFGRKDSLSAFPDFFLQPYTDNLGTYFYDPLVVNVGDVNKDGKEDFVVRSYSGGTYCLHLFLGSFIPQSKWVAIRCKGGVNRAYDIIAPVGDLNDESQNDFGSIAENNLFPPNDGYFVIFSGDSTLVTSVKDNFELSPEAISLKQNYPNPFNPATTIEYTLQENAQVSLCIFDVLGRRVKSLVNETQMSGIYKVLWEGDDDGGKRVSSGTYFYRLELNNFTVTKKAVCIK